jgi:hypothetical protein
MVMPAPVSTVGAWDALVASNKPAPKQLPESKEPKE